MKHNQSAVERLLQEISWEGRLRHYRQGGRSLENVLTMEVFQALDFLPRAAFLGAVLGRAIGADAAPQALISVSLLPGDVDLEPLDAAGQSNVYAQLDVIMTSLDVYCMVDAKRLDPCSFQLEQLAKDLAIFETLQGQQSDQ